jgi:outer membrane lipoprotein SlyB
MLNSKRFLFSLTLIWFIAGCANEPIVDRRGVDEYQYQDDLAECRSYASQVNTGAETAKKGAIGAAVGGVVGAAIGNSNDAEQGIGYGALIGGSKGFTEAERRKQKVLYRCMKGRGYRVLG